jgi:hypothetical protein
MSLPLLFGAGAVVAAVLLANSKAKAATVEGKKVESKITSVIPSRAKPNGGRVAVVRFTEKKVFWRKNKKTGKPEYRVQIVEEPEVLVEVASQKLGRAIPLETFSLATMIASEAGRGSDLAKAAVAHAALTYKRKFGKDKSMHQILTFKDARYGGQAGRYASTRNPPTVRDIEVAEAVLSGKIANPAPGAIQWDSPSAQDLLLARGEPGYESNADELAARRRAGGKVAVYLPGVDRSYLRLWRAA